MLPVYLQSIGLGFVGFRVARLVGSNLPPKTFDPPIAAQYAKEMLGHVFQWLLNRDHCDLLSFGPVSKAWAAQTAVEALVSESNSTTYAGAFTLCDVRTVFRLPGTFEEFLSSLGADSRKSRLKRIRQLEKSHIITQDIVSDPTTIPSEFDRFALLHEKQWRTFGRGGHFNAWPESLEYNRKLAITQAAHGRTKFFRLLANGEIIANRYTFQFGNWLYSELPARQVGEPWDKLGVGVTSLIKFTGQAIDAGIVSVDSGLGQYDHKSGSGGEEMPVGIWRITPRTFWGRVRASLAIRLSRAIILVCRRIWYRRVAPRLPNGHTRSQARWWLRFDY